MIDSYIIPVPFRSINDFWLDDSIACDDNTISPHPLITGVPNTPAARFGCDFYARIALDIVTETVYNYRYPYISEKTFRPIACKRLFVIVGAPGTLSLLRSRGFETFSDVIDEGYDSVQDPKQRWFYLERVIKDFVSKPLSEIKNIVQSQTPILEHNFQTLVTLQSKEIEKLMTQDTKFNSETHHE